MAPTSLSAGATRRGLGWRDPRRAPALACAGSAVGVRYGHSLLMWLAIPTPASADHVVSSDIKADFNGDGFADLAVGVPGEDDGAGGVNVIYGSKFVIIEGGGLTATGDQFWNQDSGGIEDTAASNDRFGASLDVGWR
jgi:FG-GAP repeat protein